MLICSRKKGRQDKAIKRVNEGKQLCCGDSNCAEDREKKNIGKGALP